MTCVTTALLTWTLVGLPPAAAETLETACADCHGGGEAAGGFDLDRLADDLADPDTARLLAKAHDRVRDGEMPPADWGELDAEDRAAFVASLADGLTAACEFVRRQDGRSALRRLNRREYENTLEDLFGVPVEVADKLPEDGRGFGFDTVGSALNLSDVQVDAYLEVLDEVLDQATRLNERPAAKTRRLTFLEDGNTMQTYRRQAPVQVRGDGVVLMATEKFSHFNSVLSHYTVPFDGRYRITVDAAAVRAETPITLTVRAGGTGHAESNHVPSQVLSHFEVGDAEPSEFAWEGTLRRGHYLHVYPSSLRPMRFVGRETPQTRDASKLPGVLVRSVMVEGPLYDAWPPRGHELLWGGVATAKRDMTGIAQKRPDSHLDKPPGKVAEPRMVRVRRKKGNGPVTQYVYDPDGQREGGEPIYRAAPIPKPLRPTLVLVPEDPEVEATRLLRRFLAAAYRRPTTAADAEPFVQLATTWLAEGESFESAMRAAYKAVLVSSGFLYHESSWTPAGAPLSPAAKAERLAYFLTGGPAGDRLREEATAGRLDAAAMRRHAARLLDSPASDRFIAGLADQWLDLRLLDFTTPDADLYPEHDALLQWSMREETLGFLRHLIDADRPAADLVDSGYAVLNRRLARHYGLPPVAGADPRPVPLPEGSVRGGLLTQASILKVTANGTTTSPVVRGAWVLDRLLGEPPEPPPPGIPAVEPDVRGATTVRQLLTAHRAADSCAACHKAIDPPGVALEAFDVIGQLRAQYRKLDPGKAEVRIAYGPKPPPTKWLDGPDVDAADRLPDGRAFDGVAEFKSLLLEDRRAIAAGLLDKLIAYATGAGVAFADRPARDAILDACAPEYGVRSMILELAASPLMASK